MPRALRYHSASAFGSRDRMNTPPMPSARSMPQLSGQLAALAPSDVATAGTAAAGESAGVSTWPRTWFGMKSAAMAANATTMAPIQTAGTRPATYASGVKYEPLAVNTAARTATPKTPPTSRMALLAPDALPSSSGLTAERTTLAIGAKNMPMP